MDWDLINDTHGLLMANSEKNERSLLEIARYGMSIGEQVNAGRQTMEAIGSMTRRLSLMVRAQEQVQELYGELNGLVDKILTDGATSTSAPVATCIEKVTKHQQFSCSPFFLIFYGSSRNNSTEEEKEIFLFLFFLLFSVFGLFWPHDNIVEDLFFEMIIRLIDVV